MKEEYLCKIKHVKSGDIFHTVLIKVDEDDVKWRTSDDGSEFNEWSFDVIEAVPLLEHRNRDTPSEYVRGYEQGVKVGRQENRMWPSEDEARELARKSGDDSSCEVCSDKNDEEACFKNGVEFGYMCAYRDLTSYTPPKERE